MLASYHTHTYRCKHAVGKEEEYIQKAIAEGVRILGFSDHAPMLYPNGYVSGHKMGPEMIGEYFSTIASLRDKYKDKIEIKIGLETEYYPSLWESSLEFWRPYPVDYIILGQHFVPEEIVGTDAYCGRPSESKTRLTVYVDAVIKAMNSGVITYVAHPDLINYTGDDHDFYLSECHRLVSEAERLGMPLEYNLLGMHLGRNYPYAPFWEVVREYDIKTVIGCDSHAPERVADKDEILRAKEYLSGLGITPLDVIPLVTPF